MPEEAPVTSARRPSRRKDGVAGRFIWSTSIRDAGVGNVAPAVAANTEVGLLAVTGEALKRTQARAVFTDCGRRLIGRYTLVGMCFEEFTDPQSSSVAPGLERRQGVVGTDDLVAVGNVCAGTEEQGAVAGHVFEEPIVAVGHDLDVLRAHLFGFREHLIVVVAHDHFAIVGPRC